MRGKFVTFEGTEGSGKSTQVRLLAKYLDDTNQPYLKTREPGGDDIAEKIRTLVLSAENDTMTFETEALLYAAARAQHVKHIILPALAEGKIVICDRYVDSSISYQAYGRELSLDFVKNINEYALKNCAPDLTILLDLSPEDAFKRKGGVDKNDRIETSGDAFYKRVDDAFRNLRLETDRVVTIEPYGSRKHTLDQIIKVLRDKDYIKWNLTKFSNN